MSQSNKERQLLSRRDALKALAAAGGAVALSMLPNKWEKPAVKVGTLPAFAQTSPVPGTATLYVTNNTDGILTIEIIGYGSRDFGAETSEYWYGVTPGVYDLNVTITGGSCPTSGTVHNVPLPADQTTTLTAQCP